MTVIIEPNLNKMDTVIAGMPDNKSAKIRRLAAAGYKRADIARHLGIRYQFAYNVLAQPAPMGEREETDAHTDSAMLSSKESHDGSRDVGESPARWVWVQVGKSGSIELPESFRSTLAIGEGDQLQLQLEAGAIRILTRDAAMNALRNDVRRFVPEGVSLVDALISDRREEVAREASND